MRGDFDEDEIDELDEFMEDALDGTCPECGASSDRECEDWCTADYEEDDDL